MVRRDLSFIQEIFSISLVCIIVSAEMLAEHMSKYQGASDAKMNELKASLGEHQKEYEAGVEQLRLLHQAYYVSFFSFSLCFPDLCIVYAAKRGYHS